MSSPFNTEEFKRLHKAWTKRLQKSGFVDAEQPDGMLKEWASTIAKARYRPIYWEAKEEYYRLAGQFLYSHPFKSNLEKHIWELHAEGLSITRIIKELRSRRFRVNREKVSKILNPLIEAMKKNLCLIPK